MPVKTQHKPTEEQQAVIEAVASPASGSVMVDALAGCTKSTTAEMSAPGVKVPALGLAFNKKIAVELQSRMPSNFTIKTFNGLGHGVLARALPKVSRLQLEERKLGKLVGQVAKDHKVDLSGDQWEDLRSLVSGAMQAGIVPEDRGRPLSPDTKDCWADMADAKGILPESFDFLFDIAREVLSENNRLTESGIISFDDQVYYPTCIGGQYPQYPFIVVDEAQDLNPLNHRALALSTRPDGRLLILGDPKQAIYAFRGAHSKSMAEIRRLRPTWTDRPLNTTFRCPKVIVERQWDHAPKYKAWHTNAQGVVHRLKTKSLDEGVLNTLGQEQIGGWTWSQVMALLPAPTASLAVICRNNGPLFSLAFKLIRQGVGVHMLGRDIGKGLVVLSKKLAPEDATPRDTVAGKIDEWQQSECSLARANGKEEKIAGIVDKAECLVAVLEGGARDAGELRSMLERLFAREDGLVTLSSGHKAKGLEWDCVFHLDPWRIPSRQAKAALAAGDPGPIEQEQNLRYVIETRTKHTLILGNLSDFNT